MNWSIRERLRFLTTSPGVTVKEVPATCFSSKLAAGTTSTQSNSYLCSSSKKAINKWSHGIPLSFIFRAAVNALDHELLPWFGRTFVKIQGHNVTWFQLLRRLQSIRVVGIGFADQLSSPPRCLFVSIPQDSKLGDVLGLDFDVSQWPL